MSILVCEQMWWMVDKSDLRFTFSGTMTTIHRNGFMLFVCPSDPSYKHAGQLGIRWVAATLFAHQPLRMVIADAWTGERVYESPSIRFNAPDEEFRDEWHKALEMIDRIPNAARMVLTSDLSENVARMVAELILQ